VFAVREFFRRAGGLRLAGGACLLTALAAAVALPFFSRGLNPPTDPGDSLLLLYTNDTDGFLQSCGCTGGQVGGLAKRATVIKQLRAAAAGPVLLLDGGNLAPDLSRAEAVVQALRLLHCQAVGLGEREVRLGQDFLDLAGQHDLPLTAFPVPPEGSSRVQPFLLLPAGPRTVAVLSLGPTLPAEGLPALAATLRQVRTQARWTVVLSQLDGAEEARLLEAPDLAGLVDLVIGLRGSPHRELQHRRGVVLVPAAHKGEVGVVEAAWDGAAAPRVSHRLEVVSDRLAPDPAIHAAVSAYYAREKRRLQEASKASGAARAPYEASARCAECHPAETAVWAKSKHHQAVRTLQEKDRLVGECLRCHSEAFRRTQRFSPQQPLAFDGVHCAACHSDGSLHAALRTKESIARRVEEKTCRGCHDPENDPQFDYKIRLEEIRHWNSSAKGGTER
jgi:hypothetical protein